MKRFLICLFIIIFIFAGCNSQPSEVVSTTDENTQVFENATEIKLSDNEITVDGKAVSITPGDAVYTANDIVFYLAGQGFTYGEGTQADEHEQAEADKHTVVHITKAGTYSLSGKLSAGQIAVDLGENAADDPNAVVTLVMNGADISCSVAPAVIFYNVYECSSSAEENAVKDVDTSAAGANVIIADGTTNNINGSYVARIYKSYELNEEGTEVVDSKKLHKYDAAFYSKMSMNVNGGSGILNIKAENEGLDSELHLTVNGGNINIVSGNDGINTNEDNVSVTTINGGNINIVVSGETGEGDGIDSNGWLVINGGSVTAAACGFSGDAGIDADLGIYLNGGSVAASGNMFDRIENGEKTYAVFTFAEKQVGGNTYTLKKDNKTVAEWTPVNDFTYLVVSDAAVTEGSYTFWQGDTQLAGVSSSFAGGNHPEMPNGEIPEMPEGMTFPEGMTMPDDMIPPESGFRPEKPEDFDPESMPEPDRENMPEGMERPEGNRGQMPQGGNPFKNESNGEASTEFVIVKGANTFVNISAKTDSAV